jgi:hypothetical protein
VHIIHRRNKVKWIISDEKHRQRREFALQIEKRGNAAVRAAKELIHFIDIE